MASASQEYPRAEVDRTVRIPASSSDESSSAAVLAVVLLDFLVRLEAGAALPAVFFLVAADEVFLFAAVAPFTLEAGPALRFSTLAGLALRVVRRPEVVDAAEAGALSFPPDFRGARSEA